MHRRLANPLALQRAPLRSVEWAIGIFVALTATLAMGSPAALASGGWSAPISINSDLAEISCSATSFCMATTSSCTGVYCNPKNVTEDSYAYNGVSWGAPISTTDGLITSVSCTSPSLCVAVDIDGRALTYDGTSWGAPALIDDLGYPIGGANLSSVSCTSPSFCVAVDKQGRALTYDGTAWSSPSSIGAEANSLTSVSCVSSSFCVAVDFSGNVLQYDGTSWSSSKVTGNPAFQSVSCASTTFCVAADISGGASVYDGKSWSAPTTISPNALNSVSCTPTGFCAAAAGDCPFGSDGCQGAAALVRVDGSWAAPVTLDNNAALVGVSCVSATFCAAVDSVGSLFIYHGISQPYPPNHPTPNCGDRSNPIAGSNGKPLCADGTGPTCPSGYSVGVTVDAIVYCKPSATLGPIDKSRPVIKGKVVSGRKLTVSKGIWTSTTPITYKYQWESCSANAKKCKALRGATRQTLKLSAKNVGHRIMVIVIAANGAGRTRAASKPTSLVRR
jgi:hypothetical protein